MNRINPSRLTAKVFTNCLRVVGSSLLGLFFAATGLAQPGSGEREKQERPPNPIVHPVSRSVRSSSLSRSELIEDAIKRGNFALDRHRNLEAEKQYKRARDLNPSEARAYYGLGNAYSKWWSFPRVGSVEDTRRTYADKARLAYEQAVRLNPSDPLAHYALGNVALSLDERRAHYKEAIRLNPKFDLPYSQLGLMYFEEDNYLDAIQVYKTLTQLRPHNEAWFLDLGYAHFKEKNYAEAIEAYKQAIRLAPNESAYLSLGDAYYASTRFPEAVESYKQALRRIPSPQTYFQLGLTYLKMNDPGAARKIYQQLRSLKGGFAEKLLAEINRN